MPFIADLLSDPELRDRIALYEKKLKRLTGAGPGAGMASAAVAVHLHRLQDAARSRGIEL